MQPEQKTGDKIMVRQIAFGVTSFAMTAFLIVLTSAHGSSLIA